MRDGPRQPQATVREHRLEAEGRADGRSLAQPPRPSEDAEPDTSERITLIEFLWRGGPALSR